MTLNLQGFKDWEARLPRIVSYIQQTDPDIVLLQEVVFLPEVSAFSQAELLARQLDYSYAHSTITRLQKGLEYEVYREGSAVLSRYPLARTEAIVLKQAPGDEHQRIVQLADAMVGDSVVKLANVHFSLSQPLPDFASAHVRELFEILELRGEQRIVAGDFNTDHPEIPAARWQQDYQKSTDMGPYISCPNAVGIDNKIVDMCTDHIWLPARYQFDGGIELSPDGLSDHRAVSVMIAPRPA